jgi:hypothetical protein
MKSIIGILCLLLSSVSAMGSYDPDWVNRIRLPLFIIDQIFDYLRFDPAGEDTSPTLYSKLVAFETFLPFIAVQGFGYAF